MLFEEYLIATIVAKCNIEVRVEVIFSNRSLANQLIKGLTGGNQDAVEEISAEDFDSKHCILMILAREFEYLLKRNHHIGLLLTIDAEHAMQDRPILRTHYDIIRAGFFVFNLHVDLAD